MMIKILDVSEADMRKAEHRFKNEVIVEDGDEKCFNLIFKAGCTISTHKSPVDQLVVYNTKTDDCICLFENDFSEVHII